MRSVVALVLAMVCAAAPVGLRAQDQQTLADIRQELTVLYVEVQKLKRELSTTGTSSAATLAGTGVLDRVAAIESELQRLTAQSEELENRINRVVTDGTNRIGDLEFRLVELEGGDVSKLGETTTLGGGTLPSAPAVPTPSAPADSGAGELAVGEEADFKAGIAALETGDAAAAAEKLAAFSQAYPGSPLAPEAELARGRALDTLGDTREAARAYLASFSANTSGPAAPEALFELGAALGRLNQTSQACVTLGEVATRFPNSDAVAKAQREMVSLGCS